MIAARIFLVVAHLIALGAFFLPFSPAALAVGFVLYLWMGLGVTAGYHRLLSHRAYKTPKWVEYILATGGAASIQGSPLLWVANHRHHHAYSDKPEDIHSPRRGLWWSHFGWAVDPNSTDPNGWRKYCKDMGHDRYYHFLSQHRAVPLAVTTLIVGLALGWTSVPLAVFLPFVIMFNVTMAINSVCHVPAVGSRRFPIKDDSRNVWWLSLLSFGESWHNNHHALARSARMGLAWYEVDLAWMFIRGLEKVGLAWDLVHPEVYPSYHRAMGTQAVEAALTPDGLELAAES